ncbi:DUF1697 domain-containing protein [Actinoplanes sp. NPDC051861]|uniref:DUF1697 domain-containing protein n=1 Tax=Actinoplanes sp. NPDC051861 TaxID=3155170 RepID=UPI0034256B63
MARYAALLRGINLGRSRRVGMPELRDFLTEQGYAEVSTLLQSGNVVLTSSSRPSSLSSSLSAELSSRFDMPIEVIIRSRAEIAAVVALDPLGSVASDKSRYVVAFSAEPATDPLPPADWEPERYVVSGSEMYLWLPDGQMNSPLMKALGRIKGGPPVTVRNWNTVEKLLALLDRCVRS